MQMEAARSVASRIASPRPEFSELLDRVRKLRPDIEARALAAEKAKRVPAETMSALRDAGLFRAMQPFRFGGYEYGPTELAQIGFELGRACGSTGWCGTLAVCFGWTTALFPLEAQQEVWDDPDNLLAVSYMPSPKVEVVDGGYRVAGSWPWTSGVDSAQWLNLAALLPGEGRCATIAGLVSGADQRCRCRSRQLERQRPGRHRVEDRAHRRAGVRAAASRAAARRHFFRQAVPGLDIAGNDQARFAFSDIRPHRIGVADRRHGTGRARCVHRDRAQRQRMARPGVFEKVAESPLIQSLIGQASARIDAARTLMVTSLQEGPGHRAAGGVPDIELRVRIRRNHGFAARTSAEVVNDLFAKSGAAAADEKNRCSASGATPMRRHCMPAWTGTPLSALYGTQQLGLQPQGIF